jgi:serine/threonine protein kinase/tetratricopeptide (TPR) repeat protein
MTQDSENWSILQELFYLAEETDPEDRERVLTERCADAAIVRRALEIFHCSSVLHEKATAKAPAAELGRVGPYTLIRLLGSGGIGTVYLAERILGGAPQRVALKMLAPHAAGPSFVERFHREQHILGSLDHPHITRMIDAGLTETGQPFLVMEYVEGEHLDDYCDARRLTVLDRLQLFLQACGAVAYAHRNLIVHLDLKPSNILVTADGMVKLLDFGTSKLIQTDSQMTTTVLATPAYASPEQLRNDPVSTVCDVYSLGAILFEMLSGHRPGASASVAVMIERAIHEQPPEPLPEAISESAADLRAISRPRLVQLLSGDLETITGRCLRPRPQDRYPSVDLLIQDIERYLAGRPVLARPQTAFYRVSKFVRRNRKLVATMALAVFALAAALSYAEVKQRSAIQEGRRAERMQAFLYSLFALANPHYLGKPTLSVNEFLNLGVKSLPLYIHDPADLRDAQISLAKSMWENSDGDDAGAAFDETLRSARKAGDLDAEVTSLAFGGDIAFGHGDLMRGKTMTAEALELSGRPGVSPEARVYAESFYAIGREVNGESSQQNLDLLRHAQQQAASQHLPAHDAAYVTALLGSVLRGRGDLAQAAAMDERSIDLYRQDPAYQCASINPQGELGDVDHMRGAWQNSLVEHQRVAALAAECYGKDSPDAVYWVRQVGLDLVWLGRGGDAVRLMEPDVAAQRKIDAGHGGPQLSRALYVLADAYLLTGRPRDAEKLVREEMAMATGKLDPSSRGFGVMDLLCAQALAAQHRNREALPYAELAIRSLGPQLASDNQPDRLQRAQAHDLLAQLQSDSSVVGPSPAVSARP